MSALRITAKPSRSSSRLEAAVGVVLALLLAAVAISASAASASVNASAYANNDVTVNTISSTSDAKVVMIVNTPPRTFDARAFTVNAYPHYAAADTAITSMNMVIMVGWCAWPNTSLTSTTSCVNGSKNNDDDAYPYVFVKMRFPSWKNSTVTSPSLVNLSSLSVVSQLVVSTFAGTYDPDKNTSSSNSDYITNISYNTAAVFAVFGVLLAVVIISLIVMCVCICKRDNAMASVNKSIIDKAIDKIRSSRHGSHSGAAGANNFNEHYNVDGGAVSIGPMPPDTVPASVANFSPREGGSNGYNSPIDSRTKAREMQEVKPRETLSPNASNFQKPAL